MAVRFLFALAVLTGLAGPAAAQQFQAVLHENGRDRMVGVLRLDQDKHLLFVSAPPARASFLRTVVSEVNAEDTLHLDAVPPPGTPPFSDVTRPVGRDDQRFMQALRAHLQRVYDLTLR